MKIKCWGLLAALLMAGMSINIVFADEPTTNVKDPYEIFNRAMFHFNDIFDRVVLKPAGTVYNAIIPKPLAKGFTNFFRNIDTIPTVANDLLQLNFYQASNDAWRLGINSTIGIGGIFDFAKDMGLQPNSEDLGLTFARWGYENSNYLVFPFLGPSTVRDVVAWPINYYYLTIYPRINPVRTRYILYSASVVVWRADMLRHEEVFEQVSIDKYAFMRDAYMQRRHYLIERNKKLLDPALRNTVSPT